MRIWYWSIRNQGRRWCWRRTSLPKTLRNKSFTCTITMTTSKGSSKYSWKNISLIKKLHPNYWSRNSNFWCSPPMTSLPGNTPFPISRSRISWGIKQIIPSSHGVLLPPIMSNIKSTPHFPRRAKPTSNRPWRWSWTNKRRQRCWLIMTTAAERTTTAYQKATQRARLSRTSRWRTERGRR